MSNRSLKSRWKHLLWIVPVAVLAIGGGGMAAMMMQPVPDDLDLSLSRTTDNGLYVSSLEPGISPVTVGPIHSWTVEVTTAEGLPVEDATISIEGGMPQHGHGLATSPKVTQALGEGRYLIEGMKFNMPGWWTLTLHIDGSSGSDEATFNLSL
jgi:hypothetical protein